MTLKAEKVFALETPAGRRIFKWLPYEAAECRFITAAMAHLSRKGFHHFNELIPTVDGDLFCEVAGRHGIMTKALTGREPSFRKEADAVAVARYLARLHAASCGFQEQAICPPRYRWGTMVEALQGRRNELAAMAAEVTRRREKSDFDRAFLQEVAFYMAEADAAIAELRRFYPDLLREHAAAGGLCHHDPAHHNFVIDDGGEVAAFDFDYVIADHRGHDLAALLLKIYKANAWDGAVATAALNSYASEFPLSAVERRFITCLLRFPYDFHHTAYARYRQGNEGRRTEKKMLRLVAAKDLREKALREMETRWRQ